MKTKKRSSKYWQDRFVSLEEKQDTLAMESYRKVEKSFVKAEKALNREIEQWYYRIAVNNKVDILEAKRMLSKNELKEFRWTVDEYIKHGKANGMNKLWMKQLENASAKFHITRLEALKIKTQQQLEVAFGNELDVVDKMIDKTLSQGYYHTCYELSKGMGIGFDISSIDERKLNLLKNKPWTVDGKEFSSHIWTNKTKMVNQLHQEVINNCILGRSPAESIENIEHFLDNKFKNSKGRKSPAGRLLFTENAYFSTQAQRNAFYDLDVEEYEVVATLDTRTSETCRMMDGKHFRIEDMISQVNAPPFHPWCRTCICPYFDDEFTVDEKRVARDSNGNIYEVPGNMKYDDWYDRFVSKKTEKELSSLIGIKTITEVTISNVSNHAIERVIERNISFVDVVDALQNPLKIGKIKENMSGKSQEFFGKKARVHINPETGNVITLWKTSSKKLKKLKGGEK